MGMALLGIENLAFTLLTLAVVFAWHARRKSAWRGATRVIVIAAALLFYLAFGYLALAISTHAGIGIGLSWLAGLMLAGYLGGLILLWVKSRRKLPGASAPAASAWPLGKLSLAAVVALVLFGMTWWNLDLAVRQRLETLRAEAGARAIASAPGRPPDRENTALIYEQAFALLKKPHAWEKQLEKWQTTLAEKQKLSLPDAELDAYLASQARTIELLHQAALLPACYFERNYASPSFDLPLPELAQVRGAWYLLRLHAYASADRGDLAAALADVQTTMRMAEHMAEDPLLVSLLVSYAADGEAIVTLQQVLDGRRPTSEELSALEFSPLYSRPRMLARSMRMEGAFGLGTISQVTKEPGAMDWMLMEEATQRPWLSSWPVLSFYRVLFLESDVAIYRRLLGEYEQLMRLPYPEARKASEKLMRGMSVERSGLIARLLIPAFTAALRTSAQAAARHYTAETGVAIHRYRAAEGKLPEKLEQLVPKYLDEVPRDPFDEQPLRYKVTGKEWVVYSVGQNLKEEGGKTSFDPSKGDISFFSRVPSK